MNKQAQIWITDFIIGFLIFSLGAIMSVKFIFFMMSEDNFAEVQNEAQVISEFLMSEGVPNDWTNETIVRLGLTTDNVLDLTKLNQFYNMNYSLSRDYLSTKFDYFVFFENNGTVINITNCGYGHPDVQTTNCAINISDLSYDDFVHVTRLVPYNNSIIEMVVYLWA